MESPRGMSDPSLGAFAEVLAQADCVLLLGKRLDFTLKFGKPPTFAAECAFLQIDPEEPEIDRTRRAVGARLEVATARRRLPRHRRADRGAARTRSRAGLARRGARGGRVPARRVGAAHAQPSRLRPSGPARRPLQAVLDSDPDAVLVSDGGEIGQWAQACLHAPHRVINGVGGSIGAALPFALAARCAEPEAPVIAVMGDGTFGFHAAEIDTAVSHRLAFVAVVGNDARWNAEYQIQLREYGAERARGCEMRERATTRSRRRSAAAASTSTEPTRCRPRFAARSSPACRRAST